MLVSVYDALLKCFGIGIMVKALTLFSYQITGFGSTIMIQDFHITGAAGTTIVPQVSFTDYFKVGLDL
jgi:hypothetical protein